MYVNDALEKALPEELVKSLKEEGSLKKGSDMEELDLEEIYFEILKQRISFVLEYKRALDVEGSIIWVDMEVLDPEEIDYEGLKQKISLVVERADYNNERFEGAESIAATMGTSAC